MSLFGGNLPASNGSLLTISEESSSGDDSHEQDAHLVSLSDKSNSQSYDGKGASQNGSPGAESVDSDFADDEEDDLTQQRPNKFDGHPNMWRKYTKDERDLVKSLDQIDADDLSMHLYNAHALKARFRSSEGNGSDISDWRKKDSWVDQKYAAEWMPPRFWTAWPIEPEIVPRSDERFGKPVDEEGEKWTMKKETECLPSEDLEDLLVAQFLKTSKQRFQGREWAISDQSDAGEFLEKGNRQLGSYTGSQAASRSTSAISTKSELEQASFSRETSLGSDSGVSVEIDLQADQNENLDSAKFAPPMILADDDEARRILQPTVRSILSQYDSLLVALHKSRQNQYDISDDSFSSEHTDAESSVASIKQKKSYIGKTTSGKPHKGAASRKEMVATSANVSVAESGNISGVSTSEGTKRRKGRPKKYGKPNEGETYYAMRKRMMSAESRQLSETAVADAVGAGQNHSLGAKAEANKALLTETDARPQNKGRGKRRRSSSTLSSNTDSGSDFACRRAPRDWSEVLGMAALTGWNLSVIKRAARRCENLFGEGMSFRTFDTREVAGRGAPFKFAPQVIPEASGDAKPQPSGEGDKVVDDALPAYDGSLKCPYPGCTRKEPYDKRWRLNEHLKRYHRISSKELLLGPARDNEMYGGAHVDGFMQPIGSFGRGKDKSSRHRPNKSEWEEAKKKKVRGKRKKTTRMEENAVDDSE